MDFAPTADVAAERQVIGAFITTPAYAEKFAPRLHTGTAPFVDGPCASAWSAMAAIMAEGATITPAEVRRRLADVMSVADANEWMANVTAQPAALFEGDVENLVTDLLDLDRKRDIALQLQRVTTRANDPRASAIDVEAALVDAVNVVQDRADAGSPTLTSGTQALEEAIAAIEENQTRTGLVGVSTGSKDLDAHFGGFRAGQLIVVGARPAVGKSVTAIELALGALRDGGGVLYFSLEMQKREVFMRIIANVARVDLSSLLGKPGAPKVTDDEWLRISRAVGAVDWERMKIDDAADVTASRIVAAARQASREWDRMGVPENKRLVIADYLQLFRDEPETAPSASRQRAIGMMTRRLKTGAMSTRMPFVVLAQVGRGAVDRPPRISDLRESGDIENDSDVVILLHRPDMEDEQVRPGEIDFIIAKHRNGSAATITRSHQLRYSQFHDIARA